MRIRILTPLANEVASFRPGETVDWPDDVDATRLVAAGYAEPVKPAAPAVETATKATPATATAPAPEVSTPAAAETGTRAAKK